MKKLTVLILSLLYITTSSGVMVNAHYCMGKLVDWSFSHSSDENCTKCGMSDTESKGCCSDEERTLKLDTDQKVVKLAHQLPQNTSIALTHYFSETSFVCVFSGTDEPLFKRAAPLRQNLPLFIRHCVFRI